MLRDEAIEVAPTWAQDHQTSASYREIDKQLRRIAKKRAALDVEEARWLREAERQRIWRKLGFSTALEYLEDVFGHTPRTAMERLRVAKELGELPGLEAALASAALPWSAARELSRVMTPATESRWLERARGKNVADIQLLVSGHKKGDDPDEPKDPALMTRRLVLELPPALDALFEQTRLVLEKERGEHLDDVVVFEAMCMRCLEPATPMVAGKAPKPMHSIVTYKCEECSRGWREGRGRLVPIATSDLEVAACDAELVRELAPAVLAAEQDMTDGKCSGDDGTDDDRTDDDRTDDDRTDDDRTGDDRTGDDRTGDDRTGDDRTGDDRTGDDRTGDETAVPHVPRTKDGKVKTKRRPPPTLTIPKATRDFVWARDQGRCRVPGCRATRHLTFHHLQFQCEGGDHDPANLMLSCDGHHKVLHQGLLTITGRAPDELTFVRDGKELVDTRSAIETHASETLRADTEQLMNSDCAARKHGAHQEHAAAPKRHRFDDVVNLEHAKQALMQLGFKARAARAALDEARAHVGGDACVAMLVKTVLDQQRAAPDPSRGKPGDDFRGDATKALDQQRAKGDDSSDKGPEDFRDDATKALTRLGYSRRIAGAAVEAASVHVGANADLATLIKEALRRCRSS
jgi:Holliday junction resolvasome RuvABC DNA-binding subunit